MSWLAFLPGSFESVLIWFIAFSIVARCVCKSVNTVLSEYIPHGTSQWAFACGVSDVNAQTVAITVEVVIFVINFIYQ